MNYLIVDCVVGMKVSKVSTLAALCNFALYKCT